MIIGYKDFLYNENLADDTIEMSIQFSMHIDQEEWYVASWLQKRDYAIVRIYSDTRAKRLDWYRYRLTNHIKDDEIIEEQHFHVYSDIRPDLQLLKRVCEMFAREKYIIQKGIVPDITYEKKWWLLGTFEVAERKVVMWVGTQTNPNTLVIKALSRTDLNGNKFKNMAVFGDDGSLDIDPNKFKIHALVGGSDGGIFVNGLNTFNPMICVGGNNGGLFPGGDWSFDVYKILGIGYSEYTMDKLYPDTYQTMTAFPTSDLNSDGSVDLITDSLENEFRACSNIVSIPKINNINKSTNMKNMFDGCTKLTTLDTSKWDTSNVTDMGWMFNNCKSLTKLDVSNWNTSKVIDMNDTFDTCHSVKTLDVSKWDTSSVIYLNWTFRGCDNLTTLDVSNWNTSNVIGMNCTFGNCKSLTTLDVSKWDTSKVISMNSMFTTCKSLTTLDVSKWDTSNVVSMDYMFDECTKLTSLDVSNWNTSKVKYMGYMFNDCYELTSLDVSKWDTSNVVTMNYMFNGCDKLASINVSNFKTSNVTRMDRMFCFCESITSLDVSKFDTSNVTNMSGMFSYCRLSSSLNLSNWNTSNVTDMSNMFRVCTFPVSTTLDISKWDTSKVTNMSGMFCNCNNLEYIIGEIDMLSCTEYDDMFSVMGGTSLKSVKFKNAPPGFNPPGLSAGQYTILSYRS